VVALASAGAAMEHAALARPGGPVGRRSPNLRRPQSSPAAVATPPPPGSVSEPYLAGPCAAKSPSRGWGSGRASLTTDDVREHRAALKRCARDWERAFEVQHRVKPTNADRRADEKYMAIRRSLKHADEALAICVEEGGGNETARADRMSRALRMCGLVCVVEPRSALALPHNITLPRLDVAALGTAASFGATSSEASSSAAATRTLSRRSTHSCLSSSDSDRSCAARQPPRAPSPLPRRRLLCRGTTPSAMAPSAVAHPTPLLPL
jgi:hypothetical protein